MILEVKHVKKVFGNKIVLNDINFTLNAGECLGIVGLSGCGKSTLAKIIARLISCDSGQIFLCGEDISNATDNKFYKNMQMIFQTPEDSFNPRRTLGASIAEPIKNYIGGENLRGRVENLLLEVGLPKNYYERYPREVSGGECQRAAIARAISVEPKILICDEATSALDVTIQAQVVALIKKLCVEKNIACLFITHDLALLPRIADRVIVLHEGKIVEEGTPEKVIHEAQSKFTKQLMASNFFTEEEN
ncbi:MAG: ABC transporter ATP-binding protein [Selenomonadaceae bacterium]|nr:ABC transporter ATP-binding protein [Selenomonadaceae bacterium]